MSRCEDVEPLFTPYVDGEARADDRAAVAEHLGRCAPCKARVAGERETRDMLAERRERLRPRAPEELRARCAAHAAASRTAPALVRRPWVPLSLAATLLLALGGIFLFGVNGSTAMAAQLALDHMKCFQWGADRPPATPEAAGEAWAQEYGWPLRVPASSQENDLELLCVRRCFMTEGRAAHIMYKWRGEPLSVYVVPGESRVRAREVVDRLGYEAVMWSQEGRTYAVLSRGPTAEPLVRYIQANAR